jgi:DNA polymerase III epsilon subunit-like protein
VHEQPPSKPHPPSLPGFIQLREDAVRILGEHPAGLADADLAASLFGTDAGSRWAALLPTVLGADERFVRSDNRWQLKHLSRRRERLGHVATLLPNPVADLRAGEVRSPAASNAIVTLALATTGADPRRHRIARIAVVRFEGGDVSARLDLVVDGGGRLSRYLRDAARVTPDDLEAAPGFADVVPSLRELLDGRSVFVYGARRTGAFVDAELRRAGLPPLDLDLVELDAMVRSLLPRARKPGLFAAADELGIPHGGRGSPLADAELAARVVSRLDERLAASPARPLLSDSSCSETTDELPFTRRWLEGIPNSIGVYVVEDAAGTALYVGKAVDLRRRLSAYVGRQPSLHRRFEALGVRAATVSTIQTPSDLEATLLEARLIREREPAFNVARRTRGPTTIVRAAPDARSPSVRLVADVVPDGARYFGPFESVNAARAAIDVARAAYPDAFARRRGNVAAQRASVLDVCRLLSGQKDPTLGALRAAMRAAAADGDQGEVDRLRAALRDVQSLNIRSSAVAGLADGWRLLILEQLAPGFGRLHLVQDARLIASRDADTSALPADRPEVRRFAREMFGEPRADRPDGETDMQLRRPEDWSPEDSTILLRWLAQSRSRLQIQRLPPDDV